MIAAFSDEITQTAPFSAKHKRNLRGAVNVHELDRF